MTLKPGSSLRYRHPHCKEPQWGTVIIHTGDVVLLSVTDGVMTGRMTINYSDIVFDDPNDVLKEIL